MSISGLSTRGITSSKQFSLANSSVSLVHVWQLANNSVSLPESTNGGDELNRMLQTVLSKTPSYIDKPTGGVYLYNLSWPERSNGQIIRVEKNFASKNEHKVC